MITYAMAYEGVMAFNQSKLAFSKCNFTMTPEKCPLSTHNKVNAFGTRSRKTIDPI